MRFVRLLLCVLLLAASASAQVRSALVTFNTQTTLAATQAVSVPFTSQLVFTIGNKLLTSATPNGWLTAGQEYQVCASTVGATSGNTTVSHQGKLTEYASGTLTTLPAAGSSCNEINGSMSISYMAADASTLTVRQDLSSATSYKLFALAIGGMTNFSGDNPRTPNPPTTWTTATTGTYTATNYAFQPTLLVTAGQTSASNIYGTTFGFVNATNRVAGTVGLMYNTANTGSYMSGTLSTTAFLNRYFTTTRAETTPHLTFNSFTAAGYSFATDANITAAAPFALALKGVRSAIGTFTQKTDGTGFQAVTVGEPIKALVLLSYQCSTADNCMIQQFTVMDENGNYATEYTNYGFVAAQSRARGYMGTNDGMGLIFSAVNSSSATAAAVPSLTSDGFQLNWTINDNVPRTYGYVAILDNNSPNPQPRTFVMTENRNHSQGAECKCSD